MDRVTEPKDDSQSRLAKKTADRENWTNFAYAKTGKTEFPLERPYDAMPPLPPGGDVLPAQSLEA
jgi:hypothetical protein